MRAVYGRHRGECGGAVLAMLALHHKVERNAFVLGQHSWERFATLADLATLALRMQLRPNLLHCAPSELRQLRTPCVLNWRSSTATTPQGDHYVLLRKARRNSITIFNPVLGQGIVRVPMALVPHKFTGYAMCVKRDTTLPQPFIFNYDPHYNKLGDEWEFSAPFSAEHLAPTNMGLFLTGGV